MEDGQPSERLDWLKRRVIMEYINNWINGKEVKSKNDGWLEKNNPHSGEIMSYVADSSLDDVSSAVDAAEKAFFEWSALTPVKRGQILMRIVDEMKANKHSLAKIIATEAGKPPQDAIGEVDGSILQGEFFSGEGMRLYGKSLTSAMPGKQSFTIRQPRGIAGLIVPANTPIANIAWKTFPALICGNTVVLKAAEDTPSIANFFAHLTKNAGLPDGVFNVIQGKGQPAGSSLVENPRVDVISFTGSTDVGRWIAREAGKRLARVSLELGGNNPFVVCDDADIEQAVHWATLSAFSNAGQRCASASRIIVFNNIYDEFVSNFISKAKSLRLGIDDKSDLGPLISCAQQKNVFTAIQEAEKEGGVILCGGANVDDSYLKNGNYVLPTIIEGLSPNSKLSCNEIFGPLTTIHRVDNISEALNMANMGKYGLTAAVHTKNLDRAMWFSQKVKAGVANVNIGTYGSEPHMPFGGYGASGNGTREPGVEALDVYTELKNISLFSASMDNN